MQVFYLLSHVCFVLQSCHYQLFYVLSVGRDKTEEEKSNKKKHSKILFLSLSTRKTFSNNASGKWGTYNDCQHHTKISISTKVSLQKLSRWMRNHQQAKTLEKVVCFLLLLRFNFVQVQKPLLLLNIIDSYSDNFQS